MASIITRIALPLLMLLGAATAHGQQPETEFWLGADISGTTELEARGIYSYNAQGERTENTLLMKQLGIDAVRLRVWVDPKDGFSSKEDVLVMARRAKEHGMALMIDFHYSDWWADPGKQNIPAAWQGMTYEQMKGALASHTRETLALLKQNGIDVKWVQVGNETSNGFLWPTGHAAEHMDQYAGLTAAGYDAVKQVYPNATVIVHLDNGYDNKLYNWIFDGLKANGGKWDMIGMSLYPYWAQQSHPEQDEDQTLALCIDNINKVAQKYGCDVMIVETGVEASKPEPGRAFMRKLFDAALTQTNGRCKGVFYWAPECCHGGYSLGAFQNDRPTVIMDAFLETAKRLGTRK